MHRNPGVHSKTQERRFLLSLASWKVVFVCTCVCLQVCAGVWVWQAVRWSRCPGRAPGQQAEAEEPRTAPIFTSAAAAASPLREEGQPWLFMNSPGSKAMSLKTCLLGDGTGSPWLSRWPGTHGKGPSRGYSGPLSAAGLLEWAWHSAQNTASCGRRRAVCA